MWFHREIGGIALRKALGFPCMWGLAAFLVAVLSMAQEERTKFSTEAIFRSDVVHVPIDVVVRDRRGAFIDDLRAEDFLVYDNGVSQSITLVSQKDIPLDIALVVDNSRSVRPYVLQLHRSAMMILRELDSTKDRVALFSFGAFPVQLSGLTSDLSLLQEIIGIIPRMHATNVGRTDIVDALGDAAQYLKARSRNHRRVLILISDNEEFSEWSDCSKEEVRGELLEANVVLYSIKTKGTDLGYGNKKVVGGIVEETGGRIIDIESERDISDALGAVIESVKRSHILGFTPTDTSQKQKYHRLTVKIGPGAHCDGCRIQARKGYRLERQTDASLNAEIPLGADQFVSRPRVRPMKIGRFPRSFFVPSSLSYDVLAPMLYRFWSSGMSGRGTLFDRYVNAFKEAFSSDPRIPLMLTRYFLPGYDRIRKSRSVDHVKALDESFEFYARTSYDKTHAREHSILPSELRPEEGIRYELQVQDVVSDRDVLHLGANVSADRVFFYFRDERYRCLLALLIEFEGRPERVCRLVETGFPEKEFGRVLKSGMPISISVPIVATDAHVKVIMLDPLSFTYGVQSHQIRE